MQPGKEISPIFLGTGAGDFLAQYQSTCDSDYLRRAVELGGRNRRQAAALFLPPDTLIDFRDEQQLIGCNVRADQIRHLLFTHGHWDHFRPCAVLDLAGRTAETLHIYGSDKIRNALEFAASYSWDSQAGNFRVREEVPVYRFHLLRPQQSILVGGIRVTAVLGNHQIDKERLILEEQVLNYVCQWHGKTFFYGLDPSYILPLTLEFLRRFRFDAAVLDATFGYLDIDPFVSGHQNFSMVEKTVEEFRTAGIIDARTQIVLSHISLRQVPPHDEIAADLQVRGFTLAHDGLVIRL